MDNLGFKTVFVITLCLFSIANADDSDECLFRRFDVEECVDTARFQFPKLDSVKYNDVLCQGIGPMMDCIVRNLQECPDISTFQGYPGAAITNMTQTYAVICGHEDNAAAADSSRQGGDQGLVAQAANMCIGGRKKFQGRMSRCHQDVEVALKEEQMCRPTRKVNRCLRNQLQKFFPCPWLSALAYNQVQFGIDFYEVQRAVRYGCEQSKNNKPK